MMVCPKCGWHSHGEGKQTIRWEGCTKYSIIVQSCEKLFCSGKKISKMALDTRHEYVNYIYTNPTNNAKSYEMKCKKCGQTHPYD